ncbi:unnamed protein product [Protopolystoma xenopodis]|uniref:Uncharacterized protein n=1 Tax=Protopolystoma xenopodis TaxID=117903 RepID=A0A3S5BSP8_9PLAT|nr:unnamed protein product [Protopolystoma xenopodis]
MVVSREVRGDTVRLEVRVQDVWRIEGLARGMLPTSQALASEAAAALHSNNLGTGTNASGGGAGGLSYPIWAQLHEETITSPDGLRSRKCTCPRFELGQSYLFVTRSNHVLGRVATAHLAQRVFINCLLGVGWGGRRKPNKMVSSAGQLDENVFVFSVHAVFRQVLQEAERSYSPEPADLS